MTLPEFNLVGYTNKGELKQKLQEFVKQKKFQELKKKAEDVTLNFSKRLDVFKGVLEMDLSDNDLEESLQLVLSIEKEIKEIKEKSESASVEKSSKKTVKIERNIKEEVQTNLKEFCISYQNDVTGCLYDKDSGEFEKAKKRLRERFLDKLGLDEQNIDEFYTNIASKIVQKKVPEATNIRDYKIHDEKLLNEIVEEITQLQNKKSENSVKVAEENKSLSERIRNISKVSPKKPPKNPTNPDRLSFLISGVAQSLEMEPQVVVDSIDEAKKSLGDAISKAKEVDKGLKNLFYQAAEVTTVRKNQDSEAVSNGVRKEFRPLVHALGLEDRVKEDQEVESFKEIIISKFKDSFEFEFTEQTDQGGVKKTTCNVKEKTGVSLAVSQNAESKSKKLDFSNISQEDISLASLNKQIEKSKSAINGLKKKRKDIISDELYVLEVEFLKLVESNPQLKRLIGFQDSILPEAPESNSESVPSEDGLSEGEKKCLKNLKATLSRNNEFKNIGEFYTVDESTKKLKLKPEAREKLLQEGNSDGGEIIAEREEDVVEEAVEMSESFSKYIKLFKAGIPTEAVIFQMKKDLVKFARFIEQEKAKLISILCTKDQQKEEVKSQLNFIWKAYKENPTSPTNSALKAATEEDPIKKSMIEFVIAAKAIEVEVKAKKESKEESEILKSISQEEIDLMRKIVSSQQFRDLYDQSFRYRALKKNESYELIKSPKITADDVNFYEEFNKSYFSIVKFLLSKKVSLDDLQLNSEVRDKIDQKVKDKIIKARQKFSLKNIRETQMSDDDGLFYDLIFKDFHQNNKSYADFLIELSEANKNSELKKLAQTLESLKLANLDFEKSIQNEEEKDFSDYGVLHGPWEEVFLNDTFQRNIKNNVDIVQDQKQGLEILSKKYNNILSKLSKNELNLEQIFKRHAETINKDLSYSDPVKNFLTGEKESAAIDGDENLVEEAVLEIVEKYEQEFSEKLKSTVTEFGEKSKELKELKGSKTNLSEECKELEKKSEAFMDKVESLVRDSWTADSGDLEKKYPELEAKYKKFSYLGLDNKSQLPDQVKNMIRLDTAAPKLMGRGGGHHGAGGGGIVSGVVGGSSSFQERHSTATAILSFGSRLTIEEKLARFSKDVYVNDFTIKIDDEGQNVKLTKAKDDKKYYYALFEKGVFDESSVEKKGEKNGVEGSGIFNDVSIFKANFKKCKFVNVDFSKVGDFETAKFANCTFVNCAFPKGFYLEKGAINEEKLNKQFPDSKLVIGDDVKELAGKVYKKDKDAKDAKDAREELAEQVGSINKRKEKGEDPEPSCKVVECTGIKSKITTNTR